MGTTGHQTIGQALQCTAQQGRAWLDRMHTRQERHAATEFMFRGVDQATIDSWHTGVVEAMVEWKLIVDDLENQHRHVWAGGGIEAPDHVRSLLLIEQRMHAVTQLHSQQRSPGATAGSVCTECGRAWPCPTYTLATRDTDTRTRTPV